MTIWLNIEGNRANKYYTNIQGIHSIIKITAR